METPLPTSTKWLTKVCSAHRIFLPPWEVRTGNAKDFKEMLSFIIWSNLENYKEVTTHTERDTKDTEDSKT